MSLIKRTIQKIFGGNADLNKDISVFGSLKAGRPAYAGSPGNPLENIQSLPAYEQGWTGATVRNNIAPLQDMNALQYLFSSQIAYLMQSGVAEWHKDQEYYEGSFCSHNGILYVSIQGGVNIGNDVTKTNSWRPYALLSIGPTGNRPPSPPIGYLYFDTSITRWLTYIGGSTQWTTVEGAPGDIKHVWATTSEKALERNPGWILFDKAMDKGRVLAAARSDSEVGTTIGENDYKLTEADLPAHSHPFQDTYCAENYDSGAPSIPNPNSVKIGISKPDYDNNRLIYRDAKTSLVGGNKAVSRMQPTLYVWTLIKGDVIEQIPPPK
jgi:hypothetical protein